jgi:diadenylate cyclase
MEEKSGFSFSFFKEKKQILEPKDSLLIESLKLFSPGTSIRLALEDIKRANMGALIVVDKEGLMKIVEGGFKLNCKFSPQRLVELAKMDGAIILSKDLKKILYANTVLVPAIDVATKETGTRHKAAERTAKQIKTIVIAVSERKNKITLYSGDEQYPLNSPQETLRRATETLQILEKQVDLFNDSLLNLNILELMNLVTVEEVASFIQRAEIVTDISNTIKRYLVELGKEGNIVSLRLKELTKNTLSERDLVLKDYIGDKYNKVRDLLEIIDFDSLLDLTTISNIVFGKPSDNNISPLGLRLLGKTNLFEGDISLLVNHFGSLYKILSLDEEGLLAVLHDLDKVEFFNKEIKRLKDKISSGKKI